jgi:hypothetical protein
VFSNIITTIRTFFNTNSQGNISKNNYTAKFNKLTSSMFNNKKYVHMHVHTNWKTYTHIHSYIHTLRLTHLEKLSHFILPATLQSRKYHYPNYMEKLRDKSQVTCDKLQYLQAVNPKLKRNSLITEPKTSSISLVCERDQTNKKD